MYIFCRNLLRKTFALFGLGLVALDRSIALEEARIQRDNFLAKLPFFLEIYARLKWSSKTKMEVLKESRSESGQDLFAILASDFKEGGVFLEFGAYNGIDFSNTLLLERRFGWTGLLVEPVPRSFKEILNNRSSLAIHGAVTPTDTHRVLVYEEPAANLSKMSALSTRPKSIRKGVEHWVPGLSINTLMRDHLLRKEIDFLSVDVEGFELSILETIDFDYFKFGAICVEHNFLPTAEALRKLLEENGYVVLFEEFSGNDFWFVHSSNIFCIATGGHET